MIITTSSSVYSFSWVGCLGGPLLLKPLRKMGLGPIVLAILLFELFLIMLFAKPFLWLNYMLWLPLLMLLCNVEFIVGILLNALGV